MSDTLNFINQDRIKESQFKVGSKIVCMDNTAYRKELIIGKEYTITRLRWPLVYVLNDLGQDTFYGCDKFEIAKTGTATLGRAVAQVLCNGVALQLGMRCELIDIGPNYLWVRFVSETFRPYKHENRIDLLKRSFQQWAPRLIGQYEIILEAFTPHEIAKLGDLS